MSRFKEKYHVVIAGSGVAGLVCGLVLAKAGKQVCVLEKNAQVGGSLQTFKRNRIKYDSAVHYLGGLDKGQPLYVLFQYLGLMDHLELKKLDEDRYDVISFQGDPIEYPHAQGYENFIQQLSKLFPHEETGLRKYCEKVQEMTARFSWYNVLSNEQHGEEYQYFDIGAKDVIEECVKDEKLRKVLAGANILYAGEGESSPFYIHALIADSYIRSAYSLPHSDDISKFLRKEIKRLGGEVHINKEVLRFHNDEKRVDYVTLKNGEQVAGDIFISNIHPTQTFKMVDTTLLRKSNVNRMMNLENTPSVFGLYLEMAPGKVPYANYNRYHFIDDDVWQTAQYSDENWIKGFAVFNSEDEKNPGFAKTITVMAYMHFDEVKPWVGTINTTLSENNRGGDYDSFKKTKATDLINALESRIPGIADFIVDYETATPLTQRDYIGGVDGGIYGIKHDYRKPLSSLIKTNTKIKNLFLTGQNVVLHGVLGATISAMVTCEHILGHDYLINQVREANDYWSVKA